MRLRPPATVVENSPGAMGRSSDYLFFLRAAAAAVPAGARVAVAADRPPGTDAASDLLIAVGQLPGRDVLAYPPAGGEPPAYVASFGRTLEDPRYRLSRRLRGGFLYRAAP